MFANLTAQGEYSSQLEIQGLVPGWMQGFFSHKHLAPGLLLLTHKVKSLEERNDSFLSALFRELLPPG